MNERHTFTADDLGKSVYVASDNRRGYLIGKVEPNPHTPEVTRRPYLIRDQFGGLHSGMFSWTNPNAHQCQVCSVFRGNHHQPIPGVGVYVKEGDAVPLQAPHRFAEPDGAWIVQGIEEWK